MPRSPGQDRGYRPAPAGPAAREAAVRAVRPRPGYPVVRHVGRACRRALPASRPRSATGLVCSRVPTRRQGRAVRLSLCGIVRDELRQQIVLRLLQHAGQCPQLDYRMVVKFGDDLLDKVFDAAVLGEIDRQMQPLHRHCRRPPEIEVAGGHRSSSSSSLSMSASRQRVTSACCAALRAASAARSARSWRAGLDCQRYCRLIVYWRSTASRSVSLQCGNVAFSAWPHWPRSKQSRSASATSGRGWIRLAAERPAVGGSAAGWLPFRGAGFGLLWPGSAGAGAGCHPSTSRGDAAAVAVSDVG